MEIKEVLENERYRIEPSRGYLGIMSGTVEVIQLATPAQFGDEVVQLANEYTQGWEEYPEEIDKILNGTWIAYYYPNGEEEDEIYLPLEIFLDHIQELQETSSL